MMKLSVLVVTIAAVLLLVSTPIEGNGNALKEWVDEVQGEPIGVVVQNSVKPGFIYNEIAVDNSKDITFIEQKRAIMAGRTTDDLFLTAFASEAFYDVDSNFVSPTNYLPWGEDRAKALLLNSNSWGEWFLTAPLSGCDVWIADHDDYEPLVIHINANSLGDKPVENLQYKQRLAFDVLNYFNQNIQKQQKKFYRFVQRISYNYAKKIGSDVDAIGEYWNQFTKDNIPFSLYWDQLGFFYGFYSSSTWHFVLKDLKSGKLLLKLDCENPESKCIVK